jgi:hypothetical protein
MELILLISSPIMRTTSSVSVLAARSLFEQALLKALGNLSNGMLKFIAQFCTGVRELYSMSDAEDVAVWEACNGDKVSRETDDGCEDDGTADG